MTSEFNIDTSTSLADMTTIQSYWNRQPCNIKHSNKEFLSREYFDEVEHRKYFVEYHIPKFADFASWKGKRVLEIGCGIGTDAVNFARNGAIYTGIELSDVSLEIAKKRFEVYGLQGNFFNINAENYDDLRIVGEDFDLIYSFGVIHHSPNPKKILENCKCLLTEGGTMKIMVYAEHSWKKIMIDSNYDQYEAQNNCPLAYTYTNEEAYQLLDMYKNIQIEQHHIFPYKVGPYKNYVYEVEDWFKHMPDEMFHALENKLGWHLCITANK
jgi:2-polyprenyl-3-methyl-5-hydroxy-6-metoxy-1,4-benzoquinol methylase